MENHPRLRESTLEEMERCTTPTDLMENGIHWPFQVPGKITCVSDKIVLLTYTKSRYSHLFNRVSQRKRVQIQKPIQERQFKNLNLDDFI